MQVLLFILPLGLDTLGVALSLGIKSAPAPGKARVPGWLRSAVLFSLAEMFMPVIGLALGYAASLVVSNVMHFVGAYLLIGIGAWEFWEEGRERWRGKKPGGDKGVEVKVAVSKPQREEFEWRQQLLLALSVSLDELAVGFSLGSIVSGKAISPIFMCVLIGLQGFLMTLIGLSLGRTLRTRLKPLKEWSELLSASLLIALGIWLLVS